MLAARQKCWQHLRSITFIVLTYSSFLYFAIAIKGKFPVRANTRVRAIPESGQYPSQLFCLLSPMSTLPVNCFFHWPKVTSSAAASFSTIDVIHEFNFSEIRPTLEQKTWMSGLIMSKVETSSSLAKKYHYSRKRLNTIVSQIREGKILHSSRWRKFQKLQWWDIWRFRDY